MTYYLYQQTMRMLLILLKQAAKFSLIFSLLYCHILMANESANSDKSLPETIKEVVASGNSDSKKSEGTTQTTKTTKTIKRFGTPDR